MNNQSNLNISISVKHSNSLVVMTLVAKGALTHEDYQQITPLIDEALANIKHPELYFLIDASEMTGWELEAAWDDMKLGLKYGGKVEKIAILGHKKWQEMLISLANVFIHGQAKYFEDKDEALNWLTKV